MDELTEALNNHAKLVALSAESYQAMLNAQARHRADRDVEREAAENLDDLLTKIITGEIDLGNYEPVGSSAGEKLARALKNAAVFKA